MIYLYLFLAGGTGVLARFVSARSMNQLLGAGFPYGTFSVNVLGSLLFGFLSWYIVHRWQSLASVDSVENIETLKTVVLTGLLGGFTTFSAFSMEMLQMLQSGQTVKALSYALLSVIVCVFACFAGLMLAKQLV